MLDKLPKEIIMRIAFFLDPDFQSIGNLNLASATLHGKLKMAWQDLIKKYSSTLKNDYPIEYNDNPSSL